MPLLHHLARVHHADPVAYLEHQAEVVGDVQQGRAGFLAQLGDQFHDPGLHRHVQGRGGLVQQQQRRPRQEGHGYHHPLLLSAGDLVRVGVHQPFRVRDVHGRQHVEGALKGFFLAHALVDHRHFHELRGDGQAGVQGRHGLLVDHRDVLAAHPPDLLLAQLGHVPALELDGAADDAAVLAHVAHDAVGHRRFPAAGLAHQPYGLALPDGEVEVHHRGNLPRPRVVAEPQPGNFEDRRLVAAVAFAVVVGHRVPPNP